MNGTLYNEDCIQTMKRDELAGTVNLVVTSPPYDDMREYDGYTFDYKSVLQGIKRVLVDGGACVWVVGDRSLHGDETGTSFKQALYAKEIGLKLADTMIYAKTGFNQPGNKKLYWQIFEYMFLFTKGDLTTSNPIEDRKNKTEGKPFLRHHRDSKTGEVVYGDWSDPVKAYGKRANIWWYNTGYGCVADEDEAYGHPAIFPEQLAKDHIISWSNPGDLVYDPFMGSGTVAKMAEITERKWIGSEISAEYCKIIRSRTAQERFPTGVMQ